MAELNPITRKENFLARAAGNDGLVLEPITREEHFLQKIIDSGGGGGGGSSNAVLYTAQSLTDSQKAQARVNIGAASEVLEVVSGTSVNLDPEFGYRYICGELTSLAITSSPSIGGWSIRFDSGATATVLTMPSAIAMPDGFEVEANKTYEINVMDGYALVSEWPYTAGGAA